MILGGRFYSKNVGNDAWDPKKTFFGWSYGFDYVFCHYSDAFCTGKCGHICFFFNISVRLFLNKMLKNYGFAMPLASEPRPYMAIFAHIWL